MLYRYYGLILVVILNIQNFIECDNNDAYHESGLFLNEFIIPKGNMERSCFKMEGSFLFTVTYEAVFRNELTNRTVEFTFENVEHDYTGSCLVDTNIIEFEFLNNWRLEFYFQKFNNRTYNLNHIILYYELSGDLFPDSTHQGAHSEVYNENYVNSTVGSSFTCQKGIKIDLGEVKLNISNLHLQAFFDKPPNFPYDDDIKCEADLPPMPFLEPKILLPLLIGSILGGSIVVAIIIYIVTRLRKPTQNKSEYMQVS